MTEVGTFSSAQLTSSRLSHSAQSKNFNLLWCWATCVELMHNLLYYLLCQICLLGLYVCACESLFAFIKR